MILRNYSTISYRSVITCSDINELIIWVCTQLVVTRVCWHNYCHVGMSLCYVSSVLLPVKP